MKNNVLNFFVRFLCLPLLFWSCGGDSEASTELANIAIEINLQGESSDSPNGDGSGEVTFNVTASNAVSYAFRVAGEDRVENETGVFEHQFTFDGLHTYDIYYWAYSATGEYLEGTQAVEVYKTPRTFQELIFEDDFNYDGVVNSEKWHHQVIPPNNNSWFNGERQHYTDRTDNSFVSEGTLKIVAKKETYEFNGTTKFYTSARLNSKFAFQYGRVDVRAKLPAGGGTWPAIWTLGANIGTLGNYFGTQYGDVDWPRCGEIDIMEQTGGEKDRIMGTLHWANAQTGSHADYGSSRSVSNVDEEFHIYSVVWTSSTIQIMYDNSVYHTMNNNANVPFDNPHFLLLNIAVGGTLGGAIPTNFPDQTMEIDYVRIYQ
ncbi:MAG: glycoside hydrolase family 16 protein [Flavobacteriaceae bacterium]